jgi:hypothetical protein
MTLNSKAVAVIAIFIAPSPFLPEVAGRYDNTPSFSQKHGAQTDGGAGPRSYSGDTEMDSASAMLIPDRH